MIPHHFIGQSRVLEAPKGWDHEANGECVGLPVRIERYGDTVACSSAWKPTPEQLAVLNAGGAVYATAFGGQPPLMLDVLAPEALLVAA